MSCRKTVLLILIRLKEVDSSLVSCVLNSRSSCMKETNHSPKEHELLLRLFLSSLSPSKVISAIHTASASSVIPTIRNLYHIPVSHLLSDYLEIENGILSVNSVELLEEVIDLLVRVSQQSTHYQRILIISQLFKRLDDREEGCELVLNAIASFLQSTYYILTESEILVLIRYCNSEHQSSTISVLYSSVLRCMDDVKRVAEECNNVDPSKLQWIGLTTLK